jgi:hypothetical protein
MRWVFFFQTSNLHPNKNIYVNEKETLYFIIQNNNKNRKHIKNIKNKKVKRNRGTSQWPKVTGTH